jgi:hypothetical protein
MASAGFWDTCSFALSVEIVEVIQSQTAAEPACERIELRVGKELQRHACSLEDHPACVSKFDLEAQLSVEGGRGVKVPGRKVGRCVVGHSKPRFTFSVKFVDQVILSRALCIEVIDPLSIKEGPDPFVIQLTQRRWLRRTSCVTLDVAGEKAVLI